MEDNKLINLNLNKEALEKETPKSPESSLFTEKNNDWINNSESHIEQINKESGSNLNKEFLQNIEKENLANSIVSEKTPSQIHEITDLNTGEISHKEIHEDNIYKNIHSIDIPDSEKIIENNQNQEVLKPKKSTILNKIFIVILIFFGLILFVYFFLNFPSYYDKIVYSIKGPDTKAIDLEKSKNNKKIIYSPKYQNVQPPKSGSDFIFSFFETAKNIQVKNSLAQNSPTPTPTPSVTNLENENTELDNNNLYIPKIRITVPVIWNSPVDESTMLANLQKGIVHYDGSSLPGQGKGPIFISGHSSYYWWDKGSYKKVFANLDKMEIGDEIEIKYENKLFKYQVFEKIVVSPDDVSVLNPIDSPVLELMTCVPVGTNLNRLIVKAKEI